jgi:hypothetical protein
MSAVYCTCDFNALSFSNVTRLATTSYAICQSQLPRLQIRSHILLSLPRALDLSPEGSLQTRYPPCKCWLFERSLVRGFRPIVIPPQSVLLQNFTSAQADEIIAAAGTPEIKKQLMDVTRMVVEKQGAFGTPWYWVTNSEGKSEPFFGSDRYVISLCFLYFSVVRRKG